MSSPSFSFVFPLSFFFFFLNTNGDPKVSINSHIVVDREFRQSSTILQVHALHFISKYLSHRLFHLKYCNLHPY